MSRLSVDALCEKYEVNRDHSSHVSELALALFQGAASVHNIPDSYLPALESGARLHDIGLRFGQSNFPRRSREMMLAEGIDGLSETLTKIAALIAEHQDGASQTEEDEILTSLSSDEQQIAMKLCAIFRVADGLDYSQTQQSRITGIETDTEQVRVSVHDDPLDGSRNVDQAQNNADLWNAVMPAPICVELTGSSHQKLPARPLLFTAGDTFGEAGRRVLMLQLERFLKNEAGTRIGKDIEALHDMRVATRRMRAAARIFGKSIGPERLEPFLDDLRWMAAELGKVRDFDVFIDYLVQYQQGIPAEDQAGVQFLIDSQRRSRRTARRSLLGAMRSARFSDFKERFRRFLEDQLPAALAAGKQKTVRQTAPKTLRKRFETVVAFAPVLEREPSPENYHALRIATKRFRYTAEFFREVYAAALDEIIEQCVGIQDALGEVHDIDVHKESLTLSLRSIVGRSKIALSQRRAIRNLIAAEGARRQERQRQFASIWQIWGENKEQRRIEETFRKIRG